ncbi:hypothetical protein VZT92_000146 [Zoarces viviparus]|uniref:Ribosyldihydronicotinamide dehydrogenase [quinone] n=1 Tax=Zoarces viviparus TaxID=48416 RepID=A0AAW1G618_ZOAVI
MTSPGNPLKVTQTFFPDQMKLITKAHGVYKSRLEPGLQCRRTQQTHSMAQKTALIVYAHQSPGSFNAAVRDVVMQELASQGYRVLVSDLYAMNFRANATQADIIGDLKNPALFQYGEEAMHAWMEDRLSDDIVAEQRKVEEAELIIFQFPLYWFSVPAIMKGWMDRVLTQGFAFSLKKMYNNGVFKDKKAMLSFTTGATQTMFQPDGINGDINIALWPLQNGTLHFCGFQVLAPQIFWSPAHCPHAVRTMMLDGWRARVKGLLAEKPLTFAPCELFDLSFQGGFQLWPKVREERESLPYGITTGHHLGKPLPPDNQMKAQPADEGSARPDCRN